MRNVPVILMLRFAKVLTQIPHRSHTSGCHHWAVFVLTKFWFLCDSNYRVTSLVANLGWVDLDLGCSTTLHGQ